MSLSKESKMNSIQEAEFHLSLHHYFLWRVVQEKIQEQEAAVQIPPVAAVAAGAAPTTPTTTTTTTRTPAGSATTATTPQTVATTAATNTLPVGVGFQHVMPAVPDGSHRYQIMANLMLQQFPDHVTLSSTHMFSQMAATPPIVTTLYQQLPRLQVDLFAAHNRVNQLERVVRAMRVERNLILQKKKVKKKAADKAAAAAAAAGTNPTTKRKDPPTGSNQVAAVAAGTAKRPKTAAAAAAVVTETTNTNGANKAKNRTTDPTTDVAAPGTAAAAAPEQPEPVKVPFVSYDDRIKELEHFRKGNGHCRVPNKYPGLGRWVMELRILYKKMQEDPKSQHKHFKQQHVEKLEAMGFEWRLKAPDKTWLERYRDIIKYKETHGTPNVPRVYKGESNLGEFLHMQRQHFHKKNDKFMVPLKEGGKSRYQLLDELGVNFHSDFVRFTFEERLEECREFRRKHDHLSVPLPKKYVKGQEVLESVAERSFIVWAQRQRDERRKFQKGQKCCLDKARIKKLDDLGFDWDFDNKAYGSKAIRGKQKDRTTFNQRIAQLLAIKEKYGDCNDINNLRAEGHDMNSSLYYWMKAIRRHWKNYNIEGMYSPLDPERILALQGINFNFEPFKHRAEYGSKKAAAAALAAAGASNRSNPADHRHQKTNNVNDHHDDDERYDEENDEHHNFGYHRYRPY